MQVVQVLVSNTLVKVSGFWWHLCCRTFWECGLKMCWKLNWPLLNVIKSLWHSCSSSLRFPHRASTLLVNLARCSSFCACIVLIWWAPPSKHLPKSTRLRACALIIIWGRMAAIVCRPCSHFFDKRLDTAAAMLDLAKRDSIRMRVAISNCISHTYDAGWACVPFWWYSSDTCGHCLLPWRCAPTARGLCTFSQVVMYVLLGMLQEDGVDLVIGDSSLCAVMPEVFFPCCKGWDVRCYEMAMFFLWQDELDRDYTGAIAADLLLAPVAPAWGKGFAGDGFKWLLWGQRGLLEWKTPPTIAILCAGSVTFECV